jgi:xanthine dehydrogenase YagR molybdenum-binding subunit
LSQAGIHSPSCDLPALETHCRLKRANVMAPTFMRAHPARRLACSCRECALNELAAQLGLDPIEIRVRNYAAVYPGEGIPWSSNRLKDCYRVGAERFGWAARSPEPRSMRADGMLIGMGMASACHTAIARPLMLVSQFRRMALHTPRLVQPTSARAAPRTADAIGLRIEKVTALIGDSSLPEAPMQAGASLTSSLGSATLRAGVDLRARLIEMATTQDGSPLRGRNAMDVAIMDGRFFAGDNPTDETVTSVLRRAGLTELSCDGHFDPGGIGKVRSGDAEFDRKEGPRAMHSFSAIFAKVAVNPDLGLIRVRQLTGVYACGKIINPKLAEPTHRRDQLGHESGAVRGS